MSEQMPERDLLARAMRRLRLERGWSLRDVASRAGLNFSQISRAENGLRRPLAPFVQAGIFEVGVSEVLKPCPHCGYDPPAGYMCLRCGTAKEKS
jgi:transcriptional regulator with XRE-family HTH domain